MPFVLTPHNSVRVVLQYKNFGSGLFERRVPSERQLSGVWSTFFPIRTPLSMINLHKMSPYGVKLPILRGQKWRYKGKTIRSKRVDHRTYKFVVGRSHPSVTHLNYGCWVNQSAKQRLIIWFFGELEMFRLRNRLIFMKKPNLYHGRGVRPKRYSLFWKEGKVSAYR